MTIEIQGMTPLLQVYDMPTSLHFYCEVLGFKVTNSAPSPMSSYDWVLLEWNGSHLMLNTRYEYDQRPSQPDPVRVMHHDDLALFFACPNIDGVYKTLLSQGVEVNTPCDRDYGMRQMYLHDPDGYQLCFQWEIDKP